jgi:uncharacterized protein (TIGR00730 family)
MRERPQLPQSRLKRLKRSQSEAKFLAGRHTWIAELGRLIRIMGEFIHGFRGMRGLGPAVTIFGSARTKAGSEPYELARKVGAAIAHEGYTVVTGGGPGVMEAASRGAKEAGGRTLGCNIVLPYEQRPNAYLDRVVTFSYFFVRKVMLVKYSYAFIILPGGIGTLDEMTEALTLIQTGKLYDFPVILVGKRYWQGYLDWMRETLVKEGNLSAEDLNFMHVTDNPEEVTLILRKAAQGIGLSLRPILNMPGTPD